MVSVPETRSRTRHVRSFFSLVSSSSACGVVVEVNVLSAGRRKTLFTRRRFLSSVSLADSRCTQVDGWMAGWQAAWTDSNSVVSSAGRWKAFNLRENFRRPVFFKYSFVVTCDASSHQLGGLCSCSLVRCYRLLDQTASLLQPQFPLAR